MELPLSHLQQTFGRLALWYNIKPPDATKSQSGTGIAGISVQNITCLRGDGRSMALYGCLSGQTYSVRAAVSLSTPLTQA